MKLPSGFDTPIKIGSGSFGKVYRARQKHLDRNVVLKIIPLGKNKDKCLQEALTHAQLHISYSPQIYDVFMWKNCLCIVMQWIRSLNLKNFCLLDVEYALRLSVANEVFAAVASLHSQGYVHRDLKPENILISPSDGIFLIDFGFTKKNSDANVFANTLVGTPEYMAPELFEIKSGTTDFFRADCYSLGMVLESILGQEKNIPIISELKNCDSQKRPQNASDGYLLWKEQVGEIPFYQYSSFVDQNIRSSFSEVLLDSANVLNTHQKHNDAYRLCLECMQEFPDHPKAINMLSQFGNNTQSKYYQKKIIFVLVIILVTIFLIFHFSLYKMIEKKDSILSTSLFPKNQTIISSISPTTKHEKIKYRYSESETPSLTSEIIFHNDRINGSIFINGKLVGELVANKPAIHSRISAGSYRYAVVNDKKQLLKSEQLVILPFSKIYIRLKKTN